MIKCISIDDEPLAHRVIKKYCQNLSFLTIQKECHSALEAINYLHENDIDLIFLDINMPELKGLDFLHTLTNPPLVIVTTAYQGYAMEGYELNVMDYLLKPFSFERFLKAISKIQRIAKNSNPIFHQKYFFLRAQGVIQKVSIADILFVEAKGSFILIHTRDNRFIANTSLQEIIGRLGSDFIRCHKSFVVNMAAITKIVGNTIKIEAHAIGIGRTYRESLLVVYSAIGSK